MTEHVAQYEPASTVASGWKYMWTGWGVALLSGLVVVVLGNLLPNTFLVIPLVITLAAIIVVGLLLFGAFVIAVNALFKKQGGFILLVTTILGSVVGFTLGTILFWLLSVALTGNTH